MKSRKASSSLTVISIVPCIPRKIIPIPAKTSIANVKPNIYNKVESRELRDCVNHKQTVLIVKRCIPKKNMAKNKCHHSQSTYGNKHDDDIPAIKKGRLQTYLTQVALVAVNNASMGYTVISSTRKHQ